MMKSMKKKVLLALTTIMLAVSVVGLVGCNHPETPTTKRASAKEIYSMSAVAGANYLEGGNNIAQSFAMATEGTSRPSVVDAIFDDFKTYLKMFENMLANGGFNIKTSTPSVETDGEYGQYAVKMEVEVLGDKYVMYYTEKGTETNTEIDDDETEITENTKLEGVMVRNEKVYQVTGSRVIETEGNEKETKITFTTTDETGAKVKMVQELEEENGEQEMSYGYEIYDASNNKVTEYEVEWEVENHKTEMSVEFMSNGVKKEFEVTKVSETKLEVEYEEGNNAKVKFTIEYNNSNGSYTFKYANGYSEIVKLD